MTEKIKKLYFIYNDGDNNLTAPLDAIFEIIRVNANVLEQSPALIGLYDFSITPIFLTEEEYEALPDGD